MSEDFSGGSLIISLSEWKQRKCARSKDPAAGSASDAYLDRVEELKGKILEAVGLGFVAKPEPLPEFVDLGEDDGA